MTRVRTIAAAVCALAALDGALTTVVAATPAERAARYYALVGPRRDTTAYVVADGYLRSLPASERLALARTLVWDRDARMAYFAANVLIEDGEIDDASRALAQMIVDGRALAELNGRLGYDWAHSDDPTLYPRMITAISRQLRLRFAAYDADERRRAEEFSAEVAR
jgi:hypothetical protein